MHPEPRVEVEAQEPPLARERARVRALRALGHDEDGPRRADEHEQFLRGALGGSHEAHAADAEG